MKTVALIQRIVLGIIFLIYGLAGFVPSQSIFQNGYRTRIHGCHAGHTLRPCTFRASSFMRSVADRGVFVPLSLMILAGHLFNTYMFHLFLNASRSLSTTVVTVLWILTFVRYRQAFRMLLLPRTSSS